MSTVGYGDIYPCNIYEQIYVISFSIISVNIHKLIIRFVYLVLILILLRLLFKIFIVKVIILMRIFINIILI